MNKVFKEYTTSTAFVLMLSKRQAWGLLALAAGKRDLWLESGQFYPLGQALRARGLTERNKQNKEVLTRAGRLMVMLLKEAGLSLENTKTLSVVKGIAQWNRAA